MPSQVLENVREMWTETPHGGKKKAKPVNKDMAGCFECGLASVTTEGDATGLKAVSPWFVRTPSTARMEEPLSSKLRYGPSWVWWCLLSPGWPVAHPMVVHVGTLALD